MKQRFSTRTRLVSALLTLAMVFTFLPFSAFAAIYESIDKIAFTTNGCEALQIKEGAQVYDWLESFKEIMSNSDESRHPLVAVKDLGFSIGAVTTFSVCTREGNTTTTFTKDRTYFLELCIYPDTGRMFETGKEFDSVQVDGVEMKDQICRKPLTGSTSKVAIIRLPLSFRGTHNTTYHPEKPATCTTTGTKTYFECNKCGKLFKNIEETEEYDSWEDVILPALGHIEDKFNLDWDRTSHYPKCERGHGHMPGSTGTPHSYLNGGNTCTVCDYHWDKIDTVKIYVTEPAAGMSADSTAISSSPELYSATCQWFHNHQEFTGTFVEGENYTLQVTVKSIGMGYKFVKDTTYNVNGASVGRMPMYGVSNEGPWDSVTLSSISFVAKSEAESTEINNIYLTIPAPEAGKTAEEWSNKAQKTDSRYKVKLYGWGEVDAEGNELNQLNSEDKFEVGKRYRVYVSLRTKLTYRFPDIVGQTAVINGEAMTAVENPYGENNTQWRNYIVYLTAVPGGSTGGGGTVTPPEPPVTPPSGGGSTGGSSGGGDSGAGIAVLAIGGVAVAGLVGYGVYSYVSEQQLKALLPEGVAVPENRAQTALLLWNTAGRPEPAAQPAFPDVADPDTAKAAQWCVEQGLMNLKFRGRFAPDGSSPAYKTLNAYRQLVG